MALTKPLNDPQRGQDFPNAYARVIPTLLVNRDAKVVQFAVLWYASEEHRRLKDAIPLNATDVMNLDVANKEPVIDDITGKERFPAQDYYDRHFGSDAPTPDGRPVDEWLLAQVYAYLKDALERGDPRITAHFEGAEDA